MGFFKKIWRFLTGKNKPQKPVVRAPQQPSDSNPSKVPSSSPSELRTNSKGIDLIIEFEGFYSRPYLCPAKVPTIGYGTIKYPNGKKVTLDDPPCTKSQARKWLEYEVAEKEKTVINFLDSRGISLNSNQFSALISFAYNLGPGPILRSSSSVHKALIKRDLYAVADALLLYNKARSGLFGRLKPLPGLTRRRYAERRLFLSPEQ